MAGSSANSKLIRNAMGNVIRRQIMSALAEKKRTREEIEKIVGPSTLDYHLHILKQAGLADIKDGIISLPNDFNRDLIDLKAESSAKAEGDLTGSKPIEITEVKKLMACIADPSRFRIYSRYNPPLRDALKLMEPLFPKASYSELNGALIIQKGKILITLYSTGNITMTMISSENESNRILEDLKRTINEAIASGINPVKHEKIYIGLMEVHKYLPQIDCQECGEQSCNAFATRLVAGETSLDKCAPLKASKYAANFELLSVLQENL